ncbi:hypothetical protein TNCV_883831 [Trichonephila clavipes]|nr:hypothetical protein TNCV_883831 [Trichonephila clavipes]
MRHLQSKQPRTPENPVCVEEHHQFACEARCRWSCCELALRFVDYAIYRRYLAQHPRPTLHGLPVPTSSLGRIYLCLEARTSRKERAKTSRGGIKLSRRKLSNCLSPTHRSLLESFINIYRSSCRDRRGPKAVRRTRWGRLSSRGLSVTLVNEARSFLLAMVPPPNPCRNVFGCLVLLHSRFYCMFRSFLFGVCFFVLCYVRAKTMHLSLEEMSYQLSNY